MKRFFLFPLLFLLLFKAEPGYPQNSTLIVYSQNGERFKLEVNGTMVNHEPQTRVEAKNLFGPGIRVKLVPENLQFQVINKTILNSPNAKHYYIFMKDNRGRYILNKTTRDQSGEVTQIAPVSAPSTRQRQTTSEGPAVTAKETAPATKDPPTTSGQPVPVRKDPPTTTGQPEPVRKEPPTTSGQPVPVTKDPPTTTGQPEPVRKEPPTTSGQPVPSERETTTSTTSASSTTASTGTTAPRCAYPLNEAEFRFSLTSLTRNPADGPKLAAAKSLCKTACLTSAQVRDILYLFEGEATRVDFSKYAYRYVHDPQNYGVARDVLDPFSMEELDAYMRSVDYK